MVEITKYGDTVNTTHLIMLKVLL